MFAVAAGQPAFVVLLAMALGWVIVARRMQGNHDRVPGMKAAVVRAIWDTDPVPESAADRTAIP